MSARTSLRRALPLLVAAVAIGWAGLWLGQQLGESARANHVGGNGLGLSRWDAATLALSCLVTIPAFLFVHELGHIVGGWLVGFRAFLFVVGPVRLERGETGWQWHVNTHLSLAGGLAGTAPTSGANLRARSAVMIAGGPVASALLGASGLLWAWIINPLQFGPETPFGQVLAGFVSVTIGGGSLLIALVTLVPISTSGFLSDGARLWRLRDRHLAERDVAIAALGGMSMAGQRPRDWDRTMITAALELCDGSVFEVTAWMLAHSHAADSGDVAEARYWLERILGRVESLPPALRAGTRLYAATQLALWGDITAAREHIAAASGPTLGMPVVRPLAEVALLVAEGHFEDARARLPQLRVLASAGFDRGGIKMILDIVSELERRAQAR